VASKTRDRGVDQPRVRRGERVVAQAQTLGDARPERLEKHVAGIRQLLGPGATRLRAQVEDDALLAALPDAPGWLAAQQRAAGRLDPDHLGAVVRQQLGDEGARKPLTQVEDPQPAERARHEPDFASVQRRALQA
jgi:hypothetical protein